MAEFGGGVEVEEKGFFLEGDMSERDKCFIGSHVPQAPIRGAYSI